MAEPQTVIFTKRAFNAIVTETISKHPIETGGVFLGYAMDNGTWIVVENVAPGHKSIHHSTYFEYDTDFVTYLANVIAQQYKGSLRILGLWHRHPVSMDIFSRTDDVTNKRYASDFPLGAISALVNCDPRLRLTMYHVSPEGEYQKADWYVDDGDLIPKEMLELHYTDPESLPTFGPHGVIKDQNIEIAEGPGDTTVEQSGMNEETEQAAEGQQVVPEQPATPLLQRKTYGAPEAIRDFKKIINQLSKGYAQEDEPMY